MTSNAKLRVATTHDDSSATYFLGTPRRGRPFLVWWWFGWQDLPGIHCHLRRVQKGGPPPPSHIIRAGYNLWGPPSNLDPSGRRKQGPPCRLSGPPADSFCSC